MNGFCQNITTYTSHTHIQVYRIITHRHFTTRTKTAAKRKEKRQDASVTQNLPEYNIGLKNDNHDKGQKQVVTQRCAVKRNMKAYQVRCVHQTYYDSQDASDTTWN